MGSHCHCICISQESTEWPVLSYIVFGGSTYLQCRRLFRYSDLQIDVQSSENGVGERLVTRQVTSPIVLPLLISNSLTARQRNLAKHPICYARSYSPKGTMVILRPGPLLQRQYVSNYAHLAKTSTTFHYFSLAKICMFFLVLFLI